MNVPTAPKAPETVTPKAPEAPKAPETKAAETEAAQQSAVADYLTDAAKLTAAIVAVFLESVDTDAKAYAKAEMMVSAKKLNLTAVGLKGVIQAAIDKGKPELDAEGKPVLDAEGKPKMIPLAGKAPSESLLSQYRGGWEMMVKAGIDPHGKERLVALGFRAKSGTLNLFKVDLDKIVDEVKILPEASRIERMLSLLEGEHEPKTKTPRTPAKVATVSEFLTDALGGIPTLEFEALTEAAKAARKYTETAEAELSARVAKADAETEAAEAAEAPEAERVTADTE